ncbi:flagellar biosynthetic protein FliO [candidate division KSB3 bacterium]|uniref:Flagellar protein n=1 Tax=candidate division KSB3 bacterium TaxID=2044937 RepID=A0A2G6E043_9BACT|nr:MAG: flagellar biosynthetic protein FliO [candidate division KSB3 bacterium]
MRRPPCFHKVWYAAVAALFFCLSGRPSLCRAEPLGEPSPDMTVALLQMIWSLLFVIALILALYALFRKRFSLTANQQNKAIQILEIRPLSGKKSLCLVEVEGKKLLLGIAENNISLLTSLGADASFAATLEQYRQQQKQPTAQPQEQSI